MLERKKTPNGDTLLYQGKYLYSSIDPIGKATKALHNMQQERCLYIVVSPLLGYGLDNCYANLSANSVLLFIEFDPVLWQLSQEYKIQEERRVRYLTQPDLYAVESWLKTEWEFFAIKEVHVRYPSAGGDLCRLLYQEFITKVNGIVHKEMANRYMLQKMRKRWMRNSIHNLSNALSTYVELPQVDRPIIVVGAGLTLEIYREWLLDVQSYYYIIAVDTALPILHRYGIKPDVILALEASTINLLDFVGVHYDDSVMLCDLTAHPQTQRAHQGQTLYIQSIISHASVYQRLSQSLPLARIMAAGSVGISAIILALQMTHEAIILCGIDFAYTLGKSHARGAYSHAIQLASWHRLQGIPLLLETLDRPLTMATNQNGEALWSDEILVGYAQMLMHTTITRIFTLASKHALDMRLPLWDHEVKPKTLKDLLIWKTESYTKLQINHFMQQEITYLEGFLAGNQEYWRYLDYLFLGEEYNELIGQSKEAHQRAREALTWWQEEL